MWNNKCQGRQGWGKLNDLHIFAIAEVGTKSQMVPDVYYIGGFYINSLLTSCVGTTCITINTDLPQRNSFLWCKINQREFRVFLMLKIFLHFFNMEVMRSLRCSMWCQYFWHLLREGWQVHYQERRRGEITPQLTSLIRHIYQGRKGITQTEVYNLTKEIFY